jgi:Tol biopolymer transport system component
MSITPGARLGPYQIIAPLGAGGMGEVFRATDTRLGREVAIKVLPQHLSAHPEVRARFEREAKTISSLNHPNICTLFDVGREGDTDYLVMELVEGETLSQRLEKGALSAADVLKIGAQIADALDRAHRAGVVHRDLKPGNVMLAKSGAKLMDFGLARANAAGGPVSASGASMSALTQHPTVASPLTAEGAIVGTFQYMSPEQLEGREADVRSDLWALGCVLYEMATGRRAFEGRSQASLITSIMGSQPVPLSQVAPMAPPGLERLVQACLVKDPADRLQSAHDIGMQLTWLAEGGSQFGVPAPVAAKRKNREQLAWIVAAVGVIAAAGLGWWTLASREGAPEAIQSLIEGPHDLLLSTRANDLSISPDGRMIAFTTLDGIYVQKLGAETATFLEGTKGGWQPFWSPDARNIGYFFGANGQNGQVLLMRIPAAGGTPTRVTDVLNGRGGTWNPNGTIVYGASSDGPLMRVPIAGGAPVAATTLDSARHQSGHRFPSFLPDGDHFLFAALPGVAAGFDIFVGSLKSPGVKRVMSAQSAAVYAEPGYLLFERDGRVMAQRFDTRRLEVTGEATAIGHAPEASDMDAEPVASASRNGRLAILRSDPADTRLEMVSAEGALLQRYDLPPGPWKVLSLSPDEKRAVLQNGRDLWLVDLERSVPMRFATTTSNSATSVWSPDGSQIAFVSKHEGRDEIHIAGMDGKVEVLPTTDDEFKYLVEWTPDGRYLTFNGINGVTNHDIWNVPMLGDRKPVPYLRGPSLERGGRISPDGRWAAYFSNEAGREEVYVQSFPVPGHKARVSPSGGQHPRWIEGGRALRYNNAGKVFTVPVSGTDELKIGTPSELDPQLTDVSSASGNQDGTRGLVSRVTHRRPRDIRLIVNWTALLGK